MSKVANNTSTKIPSVSLQIPNDVIMFGDLDRKQIFGELPSTPKYHPAKKHLEIINEIAMKVQSGVLKTVEPKYPKCPTPTNMANFAHKKYMYESLEQELSKYKVKPSK